LFVIKCANLPEALCDNQTYYFVNACVASGRVITMLHIKKQKLVSLDGYDPNRLFNALIKMLKLRNDAALARLLEVPVLLLKKVRQHTIPVTPALLIRMEEVSSLSARELRDLMGDRRKKFRFDEVRDSDIDDMIADIYASAAAKKLW